MRLISRWNFRPIQTEGATVLRCADVSAKPAKRKRAESGHYLVVACCGGHPGRIPLSGYREEVVSLLPCENPEPSQLNLKPAGQPQSLPC